MTRWVFNRNVLSQVFGSIFSVFLWLFKLGWSVLSLSTCIPVTSVMRRGEIKIRTQPGYILFNMFIAFSSNSSWFFSCRHVSLRKYFKTRLYNRADKNALQSWRTCRCKLRSWVLKIRLIYSYRTIGNLVLKLDPL